MVITCSSCGAKYKFDENKLGSAPSKRIKCPKCKGVIEIMGTGAPAGAEAPKQQEQQTVMERTFSSAPKAAAVPDTGVSPSTKTSKYKKEELHAEFLRLPDTMKISLAVIQGANSGEIFQISKPKMVIGRTNADITIKDPEASRAHAQLDILGERIILRDLESTNGTYVDEERISVSNLENHSEFRIGNTVFMVIVTDVE